MRAECMLTSAPFLLLLLLPGAAIVITSAQLLSFITHNYPFILGALCCRCFYFSSPRAALYMTPDPNYAFWSLAIESNPNTPLYLASLSVAAKWSHGELFNRAQLNSSILKAFTFPPHQFPNVCVCVCVCMRVCDLHVKQKTAAFNHCTIFSPSLSLSTRLSYSSHPYSTSVCASLSQERSSFYLQSKLREASQLAVVTVQWQVME